MNKRLRIFLIMALSISAAFADSSSPSLAEGQMDANRPRGGQMGGHAEGQMDANRPRGGQMGGHSEVNEDSDAE